MLSSLDAHTDTLKVQNNTNIPSGAHHKKLEGRSGLLPLNWLISVWASLASRVAIIRANIRTTPIERNVRTFVRTRIYFFNYFLSLFSCQLSSFTTTALCSLRSSCQRHVISRAQVTDVSRLIDYDVTGCGCNVCSNNSYTTSKQLLTWKLINWVGVRHSYPLCAPDTMH